MRTKQILRLRELWPNPQLSVRDIAEMVGVDKVTITGFVHNNRAEFPDRREVRKREGLRMVAKGRSIKEVASFLHVTERTVSRWLAWKREQESR